MEGGAVDETTIPNRLKSDGGREGRQKVRETRYMEKQKQENEYTGEKVSEAEWDDGDEEDEEEQEETEGSVTVT